MKTILEIAIKKALQSHCRHRVSAIALNKKGEIVATSTNRHSGIMVKGGGLHAEQILFGIHGVKTIIICRISRTGKPLPIDPCRKCSKIAKKLGIKIRTVQ